MTATRTVVIPDLDEDLTGTLTVLEDLLIALTPDDPAEEWPDGGPASILQGTGLEAVRHLWDALAPSQGQHAVKAGRTGRQLGPDGRFEHAPLRFVDVDVAAIEHLAAAVQVLGDPHADSFIRETLDDFAGSHLVGRAGLVMEAAALAGLLDLEWTADVEALRVRLADVDPAADVVLTSEEEDAYQRTVTRLNAMWGQSSPIERYRY